MFSQMEIFPPAAIPISADQVMSPAGYKGLHAFHKYWGKKPLEPLSFLIHHLCPKQGIVVDPFLGGGLLSRICRMANRRFIGIDINPVSTVLGRMFVDLPSLSNYQSGVTALSERVRKQIENSYKRRDGSIGSHYLWNGSDLKSVWTVGKGRFRIEHEAEMYDLDQCMKFADYVPKYIREIKAFSNSRINATPNLSIRDIFKGRALSNIDLLLEQILAFEDSSLRRALMLTLTAASGQMSNFVFAINKRGKNTGSVEKNARTEVGSWAIGLWCPERHFEINVWNCFANRVRRLEKALHDTNPSIKGSFTTSIEHFVSGEHDCAIINKPYQSVLNEVPDQTVDLVLTDPPHSDRIPYLELSEFWNSLLQYGPTDFQNEIVISNAKERLKKPEIYGENMQAFMRTASRILKPSGFLCILYNCRENGDWSFLREPPGLDFIGRFDLRYSVGSIVQDNRKGALKTDFALLYGNSKQSSAPYELEALPGWSRNFPNI